MSAQDPAWSPSGSHNQVFAAPGRTHVAITKSDVTTYAGIRLLRIGGAGDVALKDEAGTTITYTCVAGEQLQFSPKQILSIGTTATGIVAWY